MDNEQDIMALGCHTLATRELLAAAGVDKNELEHAERALALIGAARIRALKDLKKGPALLAALELGRRAWMLPSPAGRRIRSPVDVAAVCAPRMSDDEPECLALALDTRLTVARVEATRIEVHAILSFALGAETSRVIVALNRRGHRAAPTADDQGLAQRLLSAASVVRVSVLDVAVLGDDGFCSLLRLGMLRASDARYR